MIGDQIKYEPAWVANKNLKKEIQRLKLAECTRSPSTIIKPNRHRNKQISSELRKYSTTKDKIDTESIWSPLGTNTNMSKPYLKEKDIFAFTAPL
jgi:hypothetical protein